MVKNGFFSNDKLHDKILNLILIICVICLLVLTAKYIYDVYYSKKGQNPEHYINKPDMTIIYAYGKTCPFCIQFEGTFDKVSKEFVAMSGGSNIMNIEILKIEKKDLKPEHLMHIDGFPTILVYDQSSKLINKSVGKVSADKLLSFYKESVQKVKK